MNKIIDETTMTGEAISGGTLQVIGGKLSISSQGVTSNELAANAVTVNAIANGSVTPAKLSTGGPIWDGATFFLSQRAIELGNGITSNIESYVDFHSSVDPLEDFDTRIIREAGKNNEFRIQQTGASPINLQASAGVKISTSSAILMTVTGSGNVGIGTNTPTTRLHLSSSNTEFVGGMLLENTSSGGRKFSVASRTDSSGPRFSIADETQQDERFLINASGNVGIGVTPTSRLHVAGGITGESLNVGGGAISSGAITSGAITSSGAVTAPSFVGPLTGNASSATTASTVSNGAITSAKLAANAVTVSAIADGAVTPAKLSTGGPIWDGLTFFLSQRGIELGHGRTSDIESYVDFHSSVDPLEDFDTRIIREAGKNNEFRIQQTGASPINLQASAGVKISTSSAILMTVTGSGNVGIGTNTPTTRLHLSSSNTEFVGGMLLENTSSGGRKFSVASRTDSSGPRFSIADETQQDERFLINASGNVGIGVTPTSRLHVAGGITGESLNVGGGAISSGAITSGAITSSGAVTAPSFVGPLTGNASSATTASTVSNGAITSAKLAANAVTVSAIADGAVTPAKLSTGGPIWDGLTFFLSQRGIELGNGITSDIESYIDFHSSFPLEDFDTRIVREAGRNNEFRIEQAGTGSIKLQASAGVKFADAVMPNPAGTAPIYGVRAWVNFDGATAANIGGTYERVGTTVTVTTTVDHGLIVGHKVFLDFTTGTAVDGAFVVTGVTTSRIFTVTHGTSGSTSGNVTLNRRSIRASGNVANVSRLGAGQYAVNFATALPNENYVRSGFANFTDGNVAGLVGGNSTSTTTAQSCDIYVANSGNGAEFDASLVNVMFIG